MTTRHPAHPAEVAVFKLMYKTLGEQPASEIMKSYYRFFAGLKYYPRIFILRFDTWILNRKVEKNRRFIARLQKEDE
jgi:hypothetical protein